MSRAIFFLALVAIVAMCTQQVSAQRGWPPGRPAPRPGRCMRPNEVWNNCGTCQGTCRNPTLEGTACAAVCRMGCECARGHLRNDDGQCVKHWECPSPRG